MRKFLDDLENAAYKLQDLGEKAIQNAKPALDKAIHTAKSACEKAAPAIEEGVDQAVQTARDAYDRARPVVEERLEQAVEDAKNLFNLNGDENVQPSSGEDAPEAPAEEEAPRTVKEQLDLDVEEQLEKIRSAQRSPGAFSNYIAEKYGKKDH